MFDFADRKTYINQIDSLALNQINQFDSATQHIWENMYENHIKDITNLCKKKKKINKIKGTRYIDYAKIIRDNQIIVPQWYLLTSGTDMQKIIPYYGNSMDILGIGLIDTHSIRGKTMMVYHTSEMMQRNGMHVSDAITCNIAKIFSNPYGLMYIRLFSSSPEWCFFIKDHYTSYYQHLLYGLLEENLFRIMVISARHLLLLIEIILDRKIDLVREIMQINKKRGQYLCDLLCDPKKDPINLSKKDKSIPLFTKLWPRLNSIIMMESNLYSSQLKPYIGEIETYCPVYAVTEATLGYDRWNTGTYSMDPRNGFFEFVKIDHNVLQELRSLDQRTNADKLKNITVSNIRKLDIGSLYQIIVTNQYTGLTRYLTDEIVKIVGYTQGSPEFEIQGKEYELICCGTKIIVPRQIEDVLTKYFDLLDYCYSQDQDSDQSFIIYIELKKDNYLSDTKRTYDVKEKVKKPQTAKINSLILNQLGLDANVKIVKPGTIGMLYQNRYSDYIDPGCVHIPRNIRNLDDIDILTNNVLFVF